MCRGFELHKCTDVQVQGVPWLEILLVVKGFLVGRSCILEHRLTHVSDCSEGFPRVTNFLTTVSWSMDIQVQESWGRRLEPDFHGSARFRGRRIVEGFLHVQG